MVESVAVCSLLVGVLGFRVLMRDDCMIRPWCWMIFSFASVALLTSIASWLCGDGRLVVVGNDPSPGHG
jgi:hypothetical protein